MTLALEAVSFRYVGATRPSLVEASLVLEPGEIVGLVGAEGSGKTTLCLVGGGLATRAVPGTMDGRLRLDGEDVATWPLDALVSAVAVGIANPGAQLSGIAETVFEEVAFGPSNLGVPLGELLGRVREALERLSIADLADRHPAHLSGGQRQLVAVAGLLAMRPRYLLLDEPVAHLDPAGTRRVMDTLARLAEAGLGILVAEQRTGELLRVCQRVVALHEGRIVAHGPAGEVLGDPRLPALGIAQPPSIRLARLLAGAGAAIPSDRRAAG